MVKRRSKVKKQDPPAADETRGTSPSQPLFAQRLSDAMDALEVSGVWLGQQLGRDAATISRYRNPGYKSGPPQAMTRRILEQEIGLPAGYLDGTVEADLMLLRKQRRGFTYQQRFQELRERGRKAYEAPEMEVVGELGEGWLWEAPSDAEARFRTVLTNLDRTTRAMVGDPDLFSAEETKKYRLALVRGTMHSSELAGKPVPAWLTAIYNELIGGTFR